MNNLNKNEGMHPQDIRNLIIFAVVSIALWSLYEIYVLQPATDAMQKQVAVKEQIQKKQDAGLLPVPDLPKPREEVLAAEDPNARLEISNDFVRGTLSLKGGRIDDLQLTKFNEELNGNKKVSLLSPRGSDFPRYIDYGWVSGQKNIKVPNADTLWRVQGNRDLKPGAPVTLIWNNGQGLRFEREIALDDSYMFTITQRVNNTGASNIQLFPYGLITQQGLPRELENSFILHEGPIGWIGEELVEKHYSDFDDTPRTSQTAQNGWTGITDKYWLTALLPAQDQDIKFRFNHVPKTNSFGELEKGKGRYQVDFLGEGRNVQRGESLSYTSHVYAGAKEVLRLKEYGQNLNVPRFDLAVDFGWFWFMTIPFFYILHFFHDLIGNFGLAIIMLTIVIRTAVFPLTNTSYKSFAKMKKVNPQILEIREQVGEDRTELQKRIVELYQKEGVNPMAGCLPIVLQIPIFFALYKVLFGTIEMRHAPFYGWINDLSAPDPTSIFNLFGLLPYDVPSMLQIGAWPCLMLVIMMIQKKLNPPPQDKLQRDMMNFFPFIMTFVLAKFAAGLVIYWTFSAFLSVLQQMLIMHRLGVPIHLLGQSEEDEKMDKAVEKGPSVSPLTNMAEEEVEDALFDEQPAKPVSKPKPKKSKKKK